MSTSLPRFVRVRRTSRSPRMSCSPMTAKPGASKPVSSGKARRRLSPSAARPAPRPRRRRRPCRRSPCSASKVREALLGALAPAGNEHALAVGFEASHMGDHGVEDVGSLRSGAPRRRTAPACRRRTRRRHRARPPDARTGRVQLFADPEVLSAIRSRLGTGFPDGTGL